MINAESREGHLRLLGYCPNCNSEDTSVKESQKVYSASTFHSIDCQDCETSWPDWWDLVAKEKLENNLLIPVQIDRRRPLVRDNYRTRRQRLEYGVEVIHPAKRNIPQAELISSFLNTALISKFGLDICFATEGGVQGIYRRKHLALINTWDNIGLYPEEDYQRRGKAVREILDFYERMIRVLFEENFNLDDKEYKRAQFLKVPREQSTDQLWQHLLGTLTYVSGNGELPKQVLEFITNLPYGFGREHLRGLNNQDIRERFVPPRFIS